MAISKEILLNFSTNDFYEIAKIIDNDFIGTKDYFLCDYKKGYYLLATDKCDFCCDIRIYEDGKIYRLGEDTEGYQEIHKITYNNIFKWILENK